MAEEILSKNVPLPAVMKIIFFLIPKILQFTFPFSVLVGALMTVGRFSSDNEMVALQALGVPNIRVFIPMIFLGIIITLLAFWVNDFFYPLGTIKFKTLYRDIVYQNPELELESYSVKRYQDRIIIPWQVEGNTINGIIIFDQTAEENKRIITASKATIQKSEDQQGVLSLTLENVFSQTADEKKVNEYEYFNSERMEYNILFSDMTNIISSLSPQEMSTLDIYSDIVIKKEKFQEKLITHEKRIEKKEFESNNLYFSYFETVTNTDLITASMKSVYDELLDLEEKRITDRSLQLHWLEFYKKMAIPFGCFCFTIFAFPVGLFYKRSGRSVGFGIGLFVSILYWGMLFAGQTMGVRNYFSPFLSIWLPNIIIFIAGIAVFIIRFKR